MITQNDKIKCDWCGQFIAINEAENCIVRYIPDTPISTETFEHKCNNCKDGNVFGIEEGI